MDANILIKTTPVINTNIPVEKCNSGISNKVDNSPFTTLFTFKYVKGDKWATSSKNSVLKT